ncbi:MAG: hypothetical protein GXO85_07915 [Chlorobi bacterium]|nr:hypothetical protein [Chlorobiota bacterium]
MKIQKQFYIYIVTNLIIFLACSTEKLPPTDMDGHPLISKFGTIDIDLVETTPIVFQDKVYRFEYVREGYWNIKTVPQRMVKK